MEYGSSSKGQNIGSGVGFSNMEPMYISSDDEDSDSSDVKCVDNHSEATTNIIDLTSEEYSIPQFNIRIGNSQTKFYNEVLSCSVNTQVSLKTPMISDNDLFNVFSVNGISPMLVVFDKDVYDTYNSLPVFHLDEKVHIGWLHSSSSKPLALLMKHRLVRIDFRCIDIHLTRMYKSHEVVLDIFCPISNLSIVLDTLQANHMNLSNLHTNSKSDISQPVDVSGASQSSNSIMSMFSEVFDQTESLDPIDTPPRLCTELLPLQKISLAWMVNREKGFIPGIHRVDKFYQQIYSCKGGILADEMGLGKTLSTIALLVHHFDECRYRRIVSLLISPLSVVQNWETQIEKHVLPGTINVILYHGKNRIHALDNLRYDRINLILSTYQTVASDWSSDSSQLKRLDFDRIILDEAHCIRTRNTKMTKSICSLKSKDRYKWCISGTPMQNRTDDLFSLLKFLEASPLNIYGSWKKQIIDPMKAGSRSAFQKLKLVLKILCIRRMKNADPKDRSIPKLPPKTLKKIMIEFSSAERKSYELLESQHRVKMRSIVEEGLLSQNYAHVLEMVLRQRQYCDHISLLPVHLRKALCGNGNGDMEKAFDLEFSQESTKVNTLIQEILSDLMKEESSKFVVFSQWTSMLSIVESELKMRNISWKRLDGSMSRNQRSESVKSFQENPKISVFLTSLTAGNMGINLSAANKVFLLDPWWNPATEDQAIDRVHRVGQEQDVEVVQLITKGTIEEKIVQLQEKKRLTMSATIGNMSKDEVSKIGTEDLKFLLLS